MQPPDVHVQSAPRSLRSLHSKLADALETHTISRVHQERPAYKRTRCSGRLARWSCTQSKRAGGWGGFM